MTFFSAAVALFCLTVAAAAAARSVTDVPPLAINFSIDESAASLRRFTPLVGVTDAMTVTCAGDHRVFAVGGFDLDGGTMSTALQAFDVTNDSHPWSVLAHLPDGVAESHQALACHRGFIYIVSGQLGAACSGPTAAAWRFELSTRRFDRLPDLPHPRHGPSAVVVAERLHVFGGADESRYQAASDHWFIALDDSGEPQGDWIAAAFGLPESGAHAVAFVVDDAFIFMMGALDDICVGSSTSLSKCNVDCAQTLAPSGKTDTSVPIQFGYRCDAAKAVSGGASCWEPFAVPKGLAAPNALLTADGRALLVIGGRQPTPFLEAAHSPIRVSQTVALLDTATLRWTELAPLPKGVKAGIAVQHNDEILVLDLTSWRLSGPPLPPKTILRASLAWTPEKLNACLRSIQLRSLVIEPAPLSDSVLGQNRALFATKLPLAVAVADSVEQVSQIVKCAIEARVAVCGRGGRHSFSGESGCARGVVIDIGHNSTQVRGSTATVGAGASIGMVMRELLKTNWTLPMGHCATVGMSGLTLAGGHGFLARRHGLLSDRLASIVAVRTTDGSIVRVDDNDAHNAPLLRMARGGGGGAHRFPAILWELTYELVDLGGETMVTRLDVRLDAANIPKAMSAWQRDAVSQPDRDVYVEMWLDCVSGLSSPIFKVVGSLVWRKSMSSERDAEARLRAAVRTILEGQRVLRDSVMHSSLFRHTLDNAGVKTGAQLASRTHGWDLAEGANNPWVRNKYVGRSVGVYAAVPTAFWELLGGWMRDEFESWRAQIPPLDRCYVEFKPLGGVMASEGPRKPSSFPHHHAMWWALINCFFPTTTKWHETLILAATRALKLELLKQLAPASRPFSYGGYVELADPIAVLDAPRLGLQRCAPLEKCGPPLIEVPQCADGRLRRVVCASAHRVGGNATCEWRVLDSCLGTLPLQRISTESTSRKPVIAVVLTGQLPRLVLQPKLAAVFTAETLAHFDVVVLGALSTSAAVFRKSLGAIGHGARIQTLSALFNGTLEDVFNAFVSTANVDILLYSFQQHSVKLEQLSLENNLDYVGRATAVDRRGAVFSNLMQFDNLRRALGLVGTWERVTKRAVDIVLRLRDDDFPARPIDLVRSAELLQTHDVLATACGAWYGVNDRSWIVRRASPAFDAVRIGQLSWVYRRLIGDGNNPESLLRRALANSTIGYVAPCHFSSFSMRNLRSIGLCFETTTVYTNGLPNLCYALDNDTTILQSCQTPSNPLGLVTAAELHLPSCPELPN